MQIWQWKCNIKHCLGLPLWFQWLVGPSWRQHLHTLTFTDDNDVFLLRTLANFFHIAAMSYSSSLAFLLRRIARCRKEAWFYARLSVTSKQLPQSWCTLSSRCLRAFGFGLNLSNCAGGVRDTFPLIQSEASEIMELQEPSYQHSAFSPRKSIGRQSHVYQLFCFANKSRFDYFCP